MRGMSAPCPDPLAGLSLSLSLSLSPLTWDMQFPQLLSGSHVLWLFG